MGGRRATRQTHETPSVRAAFATMAALLLAGLHAPGAAADAYLVPGSADDDPNPLNAIRCEAKVLSLSTWRDGGGLEGTLLARAKFQTLCYAVQNNPPELPPDLSMALAWSFSFCDYTIDVLVKSCLQPFDRGSATPVTVEPEKWDTFPEQLHDAWCYNHVPPKVRDVLCPLITARGYKYEKTWTVITSCAELCRHSGTVHVEGQHGIWLDPESDWYLAGEGCYPDLGIPVSPFPKNITCLSSAGPSLVLGVPADIEDAEEEAEEVVDCRNVCPHGEPPAPVPA
jgi:hypothetical protein